MTNKETIIECFLFAYRGKLKVSSKYEIAKEFFNHMNCCECPLYTPSCNKSICFKTVYDYLNKEKESEVKQ